MKTRTRSVFEKGFRGKRGVLILFCYVTLLVFAAGVAYAQKTREPKKAENVNDLFNTSSCIPRPYRCPHPRIQFYLYTRRLIEYGSVKSFHSKNQLKALNLPISEAQVFCNPKLEIADMLEKYRHAQCYYVIKSCPEFTLTNGKYMGIMCRHTQFTPEIIDTTREESLYNTHFNRANPTKVVIHGFGGGRNLSPSTDMREAYFIDGAYNIIIVDYGTLAREPCLKQMDWGPRFCAKCVSQLIRYLSLHPRGVRADDVHVIGYSVGAHIAGVIANYLNTEIDGKLGRITGLDPSIVFYMRGNRSRDIDQSDAHFVDILHTGAGVLGQWGPNGHADFYINGGSSQPGCTSDTLFKTIACDHTRVTPYFIESIISRRGFYAYPCPNMVSYLIGWCSPENHEYVLMGEHVSRRARGTYYVKTNSKPPFAQGDPRKQESVTRRPSTNSLKK